MHGNGDLTQVRDMDDVRRFLLEALDEAGMSMSDASRAIGLNHAYLQQFIKRHVPEHLPEKNRRKLAALLKVREELLGGPPRGVEDHSQATYSANMVSIPEHDVRASAGSGSIIEGETEIDRWPLPARYIRNTLSLRSANLAIIEVVGDSMEPTLRSGDKVMVDLNDKNVAQPGIFALFDGDATVVKRLEKIPGDHKVRISSDNPHHGRYDVPADFISVAGRIVWFGRRL